jgi:WD40 repeat protein
VGGEDQTIKLWNVNTGDRLGTLSDHTGAIAALAYTSDGQTLISSSFDKTIKFWQRT